MTPEQALQSALQLAEHGGMQDCLVVGYDSDGDLFIRSSRMDRKLALWLWLLRWYAQYFCMNLEATMSKSIADRCVVRLRTAMWSDKHGGLHAKKSLTFLRRRCSGYNLLDEDTRAAGVEEVLPRILNLWSAKDGVYTVVVCNASVDLETGYVDGYDYRLVPV